MTETKSHTVERNKDTQRIIGEVQLRKYGNFLEKYNGNLKKYEKGLSSGAFKINPIPITIKIRAKEQITLLQLVCSDNTLLSRILVSLATLCNEMMTLEQETVEYFYNYHHKFVNYVAEEGFDVNGDDNKLLDMMQRALMFLDRCEQVMGLTLKQLCVLMGKGLYANSTAVPSFPEPMKYLSQILVCLITFDTLFSSDAIIAHWKQYKRAVSSTFHHNNAQQTGLGVFNAENIRALHRKLVEFERDLFTGNIFKRTVEKCISGVAIALKNYNLSNEILLSVQQMILETEKGTECNLMANALYAFHYYAYGNIDKKTLKRLLEMNKKMPPSACTLMQPAGGGNALLTIETFLLKHIPLLNKQIDIKSIQIARNAQFTQRCANLAKESHRLCMKACFCLIAIEKLLKADKSCFKIKQLYDSGNVFIESTNLIQKISGLVKWITTLHADAGSPAMTKSMLLSVCKLIELLKCFQITLRTHIIPLSYVILLINQHLTHKGLSILANIKKSFIQDKAYKEQQLDVLSAMVVAEHALKGPNTDERLLVVKLALSASGLPHEQLIEMRAVINRLELVCNCIQSWSRLTSCSFLLPDWYQALFPVYFSTRLNNSASTTSDLNRSYLMMAALSDASPQTNPQSTIKESLISPLNQMVEINLRMQTHLHLQLPTHNNPFEKAGTAQIFKKIDEPVLLSEGDSYYVNIKQEVEHYLSTIFYNLTTVVLHDWRTYGEMRRLAALQYGLQTVEDSLPMQTLEQGLDVLEIMRNIHVFVGKYLYNMNNQIFVEKLSNNKHLNTISIYNVANSIRTHGIGIMSTTVNFTYQFLQNKFYIFSQFMFDEHIKSRLLKDIRFFADHKNEYNQLYPYFRAEKFNFGIRKLGLNENGMSYLDQFRTLITHIGNAMGYVRLVRSGGKRCVADTTCFLPDLKVVDEFNTLLNEELNVPIVSELTNQAGNCLKRDINNLVDNFEEATEYFKLLVSVFAPAFRDAKNMHLRNFYVIVPPLTINFIEHSLTCKEKINKKNNREGAAFTDDGFAMGLAYIIELLDQTRQFNSLHWFQSVKLKLAQDKQTAQPKAMHKEDVKLQQTLSLTEKRIDAFQKEFQLFHYSYSSARNFFQS